jgi:hypothetical protein
MIQKIRELLGAAPFVPFAILTSGGKRYRVETADHAGINPQGSMVFIWFDDEGSLTISGLHIAAIEEKAAAEHV